MAANQGDEVPWRVASQRGTAELRVLGQEVGGTGAQIGEIAASTARDADFFSQLSGMVDQHNAQAALSRHSGGHHARRAGAHYRDIKDHAPVSARHASRMQST